jgi:hypothetical protein
VAIGLTASAGVAVAQSNEPTVQARLRIAGSAGCLSAPALQARVHARSARIDLAPSHPGALLSVALRGDQAAGFAAELSVLWSDGRSSLRQFEARTCAAAIDALAFMIVLALDPGAQPPDDHATAPGLDRAVSPRVAADTGADMRSAPDTEAHFANTARASDTSDGAAKASAGARLFEHLELGARAAVALGVAPSAQYGLGMYALAALPGSTPWLPALQLRAARLWQETVTTGGQADFRLDVMHLDTCPLGLTSRNLTGRLCLTAGLGSLRAAGSSTYAPRSHSRLWTDWGGTLLLSLRVGRLVHAQLGAGAMVPTRRDSFSFRPDVFHRVSAVCAQIELGVGLRFP